MKRRFSRLSRTSSQGKISIEKTPMSDFFEKFVQENLFRIMLLLDLANMAFSLMSSIRRQRSPQKKSFFQKVGGSFKGKARAYEEQYEKDQKLADAAKITKMSNLRSSYIKISYNRDAVIILLIRKRGQLNSFSVDFEDIASTEVIFQLLFESRKKNYLVEIDKYLNSLNFHFIDQIEGRFQRWISRFRNDSAAFSKIIDFASRQFSESRMLKRIFSSRRRSSFKERSSREFSSPKTKRDSSRHREFDREFDFSVSSVASDKRASAVKYARVLEQTMFQQLSSRSFYKQAQTNPRKDREGRNDDHDRRHFDEEDRARRTSNDDFEIDNVFARSNENLRRIVFDENPRMRKDSRERNHRSRDSYANQARSQRDPRMKLRIRYEYIDYNDHVSRQNRRLQFVSQYSNSSIRQDFRYRENDLSERPWRQEREKKLQYQQPRHRSRRNEFRESSRQQSKKKVRGPRYRDRYEKNEHDHRVLREAKRTIKLRSQDVMIFDLKEQSVAFFIKRFQHIVELKEEFSVLRVLLMCLKDFALEWHNSLSVVVRREMNLNIKMWKNELLREYRPNRFESLKKIEALKFRFDKNLILSQYLSRKTNLLHDAEIHDEETMICYLWESLEVNLTLTTLIRKDDDTLKSFDRRVRRNEETTRRVHKKKKPYDSKYDEKKTFSKFKLYIKNEPEISAERVQKLIEKLSTDSAAIEKIKFKSRRILNIISENSRKSPRLCRHCEKDHWDKNCEKNKKETKKILLTSHDVEFLNEEDLQIYEKLERMIVELVESESRDDL